MKMQTSEIKVGMKFYYDDNEWICTSNDGFIFTADNLSNSNMTDMMLVGISEEVEVIE